MTLFEYLAAAYTLLLSFSVIRLIGGLSSAIDRERRYWVHLVMVAAALYSISVLFWGFWSFRGVDWNYPRFVLSLAVPALVHFLATVIMPASSDAVESWQEFYYSVRPKYFAAWIVFGFLIALNSTVLLDMPLMHPARLGQITLIALGIIGAVSGNPRVHSAIACCVLALSAFGVLVIFFEPGSLAN
jgi:hypothetical protein